MAETVNEIQVKFSFDTTSFKKGVSEVESSVDKAIKELDDMERTANSTVTSTDEIGDSFDNLGDSAKRASDELKNMGESTSGAKDAVDKLQKPTQETSEGMENLGNETHKTKGKFSELEEFISGKLTTALSVAGIVGVLIGVTSQLKKVQDEVVNTSNEFQALYGEIGKASDAYATYQASKQYLSGGTNEQKTTIADAVTREFSGLSSEDSQKLQQEILTMSNALGVSGEQMVYDLGEVASKWGVTNDKLLETLQTIIYTSSNQMGNRAENYTENVKSLMDFDKMFQAGGFDLEKTLALFATLDSAENRKSVYESSTILNKEFTKGMSDIASAQDKSKEYQSQLDAATAERNAYAQELSRLTALLKATKESTSPTASKDITTIENQIDKVTSKITDSTKKIEELTASFTTSSQTANKTASDVFKGVITTESLSYSDLSTKGGDLSEVIEVARLANDVLNNINSSDLVKKGTGESTPIALNIIEGFQKSWDLFLTDTINKIMPTEASKQASQEWYSARAEYESLITEVINNPSWQMADTDKKFSKYLDYYFENDVWNKWVSQGNTELVKQYTDELKTLIENQKITVDLNIKQNENSYVVADASAKASRGNQASIVY